MFCLWCASVPYWFVNCFHLFPCPAPYCSLTSTLKNGGILNKTTGTLGSKVHYFCKPGYRMIGHSNATCRRNPVGVYQWDSIAPLCQGKRRLSTPPGLPFIVLILVVLQQWKRLCMRADRDQNLGVAVIALLMDVKKYGTKSTLAGESLFAHCSRVPQDGLLFLDCDR